MSIESMLVAAAGKEGLLLREHAHRHGVSNKVLARLVAEGELEARTSTLFVVAGTPPSMRQEVLAPILATGGRYVAGGRSAAGLHGFDGYDFDDTVPELFALDRYRRFEWPGFTIIRSGVLDASENEAVQGIPATGAIRTWLTLCALEPEDRVEAVLDAAERDKLIDISDLRERFDQLRARGRNGVATAGAILERRVDERGVPHTVLERALLRIIRRRGIVMPVCQYPVPKRGGGTAFIDVAWPELDFGAEADGHGAHATRAQRRNDTRRQNALPDGFELVRFTWEDINLDPEYVGRELTRRIEARARALGQDPTVFFASGRPIGRSGAKKSRGAAARGR